MDILQLNNVVKAYGKYLAVDHVSFSVPEGSIFGLLGPNGAGKTSLIRIITTITGADEGTVFFNGEKLSNSHPEQIGYMPEERGLYKKMKVGEELLYLAQLKGLSYSDARTEIIHWMTKFEIKDWWYKKVEELSKGMQQKVQFITTVIHKPKLLILDEPFTGLDPINAALIKDEIHELKRQGTTIIFSTHRMEQVEEICEYIMLINKGRNVLEGRVTDIKNEYKENLFRIEFQGALPDSIRENTEIIEQHDQSLTVRFNHGRDTNQLLSYLINNGVHVTSFNEILPSINDIFIKRVEESSSNA